MHDLTVQPKASLSSWGCNYPVIEVVGEVLFILLDERSKFTCHHPLEEWRCILQPEIHHSRYVSSIYHLEGHLVLIF